MPLEKNNIIKRAATYICVLFTFMFFQSHAQISPGELTRAHAHLEGMLSCTKCHVLGDKVSNEKCLDCHKEIKSRIDQKKGFHSSTEVKGKDCFSCHSDHHGRNFEIVRFDTEKFNHDLTGYKLTGAHTKPDCRACHRDERIESAELRKKEETYLGLKTDCISCHKDAHNNTLSTNDCAKCHNTEKFAPAPLFDHAKTKFPLKGKHKDADCKRCHEITFVNSAIFQKFADVPFNTCAVCHADVHNGQFGTNCKECHTEESFNVFVGKSTFDHSTTRFPLVGKHQAIDCAKCHKLEASTRPDNVFQDYKNKDISTCVTCHKDVHESRLGTDCRQCHTEDSFQKIKNKKDFDHGLTGYPLEGKHITVDCKKCHETKMTDPLEHNRCADCHDDFHKGQFVNATITPDCRDCHTVEGFMGSLFTIEKHNQGTFPLTGAHLATPCFSCHKKEEEWSFRNIGQNCIDCHDDVHEGYISEQYYPGKACNQCHVADEWASVSFAHEKTKFALAGKHSSTSCVACHVPDTTVAKIQIGFLGLKQDCVACHDNIHDRQFEKEGTTDCTRCHTFEAWKPGSFDHSSARFPLEGAHKDVACKECHKPEMVEGKSVIQYKLEDFACASCHSD
jgi:nitrate/TMAO reductase-like tetraheme cytochrome c subunit